MSIPLDDALTPSLLIEETASGSLDTPASGEQRLSIDPTTHHLYRKDDSADTDLEVVQKAVTSNPSSPANGDVWFFDDGGTPATLFVRWKKGGTIYSFPIGSAV